MCSLWFVLLFKFIQFFQKVKFPVLISTTGKIGDHSIENTQKIVSYEFCAQETLKLVIFAHKFSCGLKFLRNRVEIVESVKTYYKNFSKKVCFFMVEINLNLPCEPSVKDYQETLPLKQLKLISYRAIEKESNVSSWQRARSWLEKSSWFNSGHSFL